MRDSARGPEHASQSGNAPQIGSNRSTSRGRRRARACPRFKPVRQIGTPQHRPPHGAVLLQPRAHRKRADPLRSGGAARVPPGALLPGDGGTSGGARGIRDPTRRAAQARWCGRAGNMQWQTREEAKTTGGSDRSEPYTRSNAQHLFPPVRRNPLDPVLLPWPPWNYRSSPPAAVQAENKQTARAAAE